MVKRGDMAVENKGLNNGQVHRVLEDLETISMVQGVHTHAIVLKDEKLTVDSNNLMRQVLDALGRDITGMFNGSAKK